MMTSGGTMCPKKKPFFNRCDVIVIRNYDVSQLMKLVWEIQTYPVINFPKYVACHLHDKKKLEDPYYLLNLSLDHRQS